MSFKFADNFRIFVSQSIADFGRHKQKPILNHASEENVRLGNGGDGFGCETMSTINGTKGDQNESFIIALLTPESL